jgi:hypothetical protein
MREKVKEIVHNSSSNEISARKNEDNSENISNTKIFSYKVKHHFLSMPKIV